MSPTHEEIIGNIQSVTKSLRNIATRVNCVNPYIRLIMKLEIKY